MTKFDIVIIGAGPAGAYLAYKLKKQGISVLILEKDKFPRYKICAGGLSKKAYDILFLENKNIEKIIEKKVKKGLFVRDNKFTIQHAENDLIYMTYRSELDRFITDMAVDNKSVILKDNIDVKEINLKENTMIYIEKNNEYKVNFKVLVGAWGCNIRLNSMVGISPFERFSVSSSWEGPSGPVFEKYFDEATLCQIIKNYPGFVGYIFPKSKEITAGLFTSIFPVPSDIKKMWKDFIEFWELDPSIKPHYALIPIRDYKIPIAKDNILLVGDAGGLADPFTGEGIYYSLISSQIASIHIIKYLKNKNYDLAHKYNEEIGFKLGDIQRWAKRYEFLFHLFPNFFFWFGSECKIGNEIINAFITGEIKYNEIKKIISLVFRCLLIKK